MSGVYQKLDPLPQADGLRAVAALLVFFYHMYGVAIGKLNLSVDLFPFGNFIQGGASGVTLFFLLSGFLLVRPFIAGGVKSGDYSGFLRNRILRIYPMFVSVLLIATVFSGSSDRVFMFWRALLMGFGANDYFPFSIPWWSLRTEFEFYLMATIFLLVFHFKWAKLIYFVFLFLAAYALFYLYSSGFPILNKYRFVLMQSAVAYAPVFAMGIVVAFAHVKFKYRLAQTSDWRLKVFGDLLIFLLILLLNEKLGLVARSGMQRLELSNFSHHYFEALCWAGILAVLTVTGSNFVSLLSLTPLRWIGKISYSFYLVHLPVAFYCLYGVDLSFLSVGSDTIKFWMLSCVCLALSLLLASICYNFVEKPFLRLKSQH